MTARPHAFTGRGWLYATTAAIAGATTIVLQWRHDHKRAAV